MQFTWVDYPNQYAAELENWCDDTVFYAVDDESIKEEHNWYIDSGEYTLNKNFFSKIILEGKTAVALLLITTDKDETKIHLPETIVYIQTLIINPAMRRKGYATKIITELIEHAGKIIFSNNNIFIAQIDTDNDKSKKLFDKLGFHCVCTDAEINDDLFDWIYPISATTRYIVFRDRKY